MYSERSVWSWLFMRTNSFPVAFASHFIRLVFPIDVSPEIQIILTLIISLLLYIFIFKKSFLIILLQLFQYFQF